MARANTPSIKLNSFQIVKDKLGMRENVPGILLSEAFMAAGSLNVMQRYGEYRRIPGRLAEIIDSDAVAIAAPIFVYAITAVSKATKTFTISGNHATDIAANVITISDIEYVRINGSTGNDKRYTYVSATDNGANTDIVVSEAIDDATVDGDLHVGATPVLAYQDYTKRSTGTEYLFLATKYHILLWTFGARTLAVMWDNGTPTDVTRWEIVAHLDNVYATNNSDPLLEMLTSVSMAGPFAELDAATGIVIDGSATRMTKCKHIFSWQTHLFAGYTVEGGTTYPTRGRWCSQGDVSDWNEDSATNTAGAKDFDNTAKGLMGFGVWGDDFLVVAKEDRMYRGWLVEDVNLVFDFNEEANKVGSLSADAMVNDKAGRFFFLASDLTIREFGTPSPVMPLLDVTLRKINTAVTEFAQAEYIDRFNRIYFAVALGSSETNDHVIEYEVDSGRGVLHKYPVRAFGQYARQEVFTYDTLPFATYDDWGASWLIYDTDANVAGFPLDLAGGYDGVTYALNSATQDAGADLTGTMIFRTTLTPGKHASIYKEVNRGIALFFNKLAGATVQIEHRIDGNDTWEVLGSVSLSGNNSLDIIEVFLPARMRFKWCDFRLTSTAMFEFIGMFFDEFILEGTR